MSTGLDHPFLAPAPSVPPRTVPLWLRCHLLAGPLTVGGAGAFACTMFLALIVGQAGNPAGAWPPGVLLVLPLPAIAFLVAAIGLALGRRRLHLLRQGEAVPA